MHDHRSSNVRPEVILDALMAQQQVRVAGDVVAIDEQVWAIHGIIPVDGEVILAEFTTREQAKAALDGLSSNGAAGAGAEARPGDDWGDLRMRSGVPGATLRPGQTPHDPDLGGSS